MANPVTPLQGLVVSVAVGGTASIVFPANISGGFVTNPSSSTDQGISAAENLYVNPVGNAGTAGNGTTFALLPGQTWSVIPGQTTTTTVNCVTSGHQFTAVYWF